MCVRVHVNTEYVGTKAHRGGGLLHQDAELARIRAKALVDWQVLVKYVQDAHAGLLVHVV